MNKIEFTDKHNINTHSSHNLYANSNCYINFIDTFIENYVLNKYAIIIINYV